MPTDLINSPALEVASEKIRNGYEKNLHCLSLDKLGHFFERAYKITGDKKYEVIIAFYIYTSKIKKIRAAIRILKAKKFPKINAADLKTKNLRKLHRFELYKKNPRIKFFNELAIHMFFLKSFGLAETVLKDDFAELIALLKKEDFKKLYLNEACLKADSSFSFNTLSILKRFKIINLLDKAELMLKKMYITGDSTLIRTLPNHELSSLIYSMTHIIIAESGFYDSFVLNHAWIINFLKKNMALLISNLTNDILAEVGLCIRLCKKESYCRKELNMLLNYLWEKSELEKLDNPNFLIENEHPNSILMILFSKKLNLKSGPDISHYKLFDN
ncbi:MAG: DUF3541 domain-containing protein [Candidatus Moranbacteria bacterium]|nr:DUF3541 domain-containing protein [Candidatus Moranbacteria bacterium]